MMQEEKIALDITSNDYAELLIRHLARDNTVLAKAKALHITGNDFVLDDTYGIQLYKEFVDAIITIGHCPDFETLGRTLGKKVVEGAIPETQTDTAAELLNWIYQGELTPGLYLDTLKDFLKRKRTAQIQYQHEGNPDLIFQNMQSLMVDLSTDDFMTQAKNIHPFAKPLYKHKQELYGTGLRALDEHIQGLGLSEYGIIIGYSGGGKTVFGCNVIQHNAIVGLPSTFVSLEADDVEISNRNYSKFFEIPYTELHRGNANYELETKFKDELLRSQRETLAKNLCVLGLKGLTPITPEQIYQVMLRKAEEEGFIPSVVVVDQLQFIEPSSYKKSMQSWELEKLAAAEMDELSHRTINGQKFALWVLHQAKGKLKRNFSRDEIDGFKGIIHKADLVLGIGRESNKATKCSIFSLKVRHCADFDITFETDFQYMRFLDSIRQNGEGMALESWTQQDRNNIPDNGPPPPPPNLPPDLEEPNA